MTDLERVAQAIRDVVIEYGMTYDDISIPYGSEIVARAALAAAGAWQDIATAPKDQEVLVVNAKGQITRGWQDPDAHHGWFLVGAQWQPTHWMPLPAPPPQETE